MVWKPHVTVAAVIERDGTFLLVEEETDEDLALADGPAPIEDDGSRLAFNWRSDERRYRRFPKADKPADAGE